MATALRFLDLGGLSFWFDEVVAMEVARQPGPMALLQNLPSFDATAAPLHPLLLQAWLGAFGTSEAAARAFSAACDILSVLLIARIGRRLGDSRAGLWAAWLAALSPLLVRYAREARMYALLVLLTTIAWDLLLSFEGKPSQWRKLAYVLALDGLALAHPLGLLMVATIAGASWFGRRRFQLSTRAWLGLHVAAGVLISTWIHHYLDHPPEVTSSEWLAPRYLVGLPIGFIGGNRFVLGGCLLLILWGTSGGRRFSAWIPLVWFAVPPLLLYGYSLVSHPIFGQARYTLFVGPAYLLLLGRGLSRLPKLAAVLVAGGLAVVSASAIHAEVFDPGAKADWRSAAEAIRRADPVGAIVVIYSEDPRWAREADVARFYLRDLDWVLTADHLPVPAPSGPIWHAVGLRDGKPVAALPPGGTTIDLRGLRLSRQEDRQSSAPPHRGSP